MADNKQLDDQYRQPPPESDKVKVGDVCGIAGIHINTGMVQDEFLLKLHGDKARKVYREMRDNDPTVGAILFAVEMMLRASKWRVEAKENEDVKDSVGTESLEVVGSQIKDHESAKAFLESVLFEDMTTTWDEFIAIALSMLPYGWQYTEICYKKRNGLKEDPKLSSQYDDGLIGIEKLADRSQETLDRWDMGSDGTVYGMWQYPPNYAASMYIPAEKAIHFRPHPFKDSPEGRSMLRNAYRPWYFLKNIQEIEAIAIERELNGLPVVHIPNSVLNGATPEAKTAVAQYKKMVRDVKFNEQGGLVLPSDPYYDDEGKPSGVKQVEFSLVSANGSRAIDSDKVIKRYQSDIARTILAQFILLSQSGSSGGYAQSENESDMFLRAAEGWLESIASTINRQLVTKIWKVNGLDQALMPKVVPGKLKPADLEALGNYIQKLAGAGLSFIDEETEKHLRNIADLPAGQLNTEDEVVFDNDDPAEGKDEIKPNKQE